VGINEFYLYVTIFLALQYMAGLDSSYFKLDFVKIFNIANVTTTANRFVPLPGGELSIE
jgi:hypothetical protein